jgi:predicted regulator of Ras-like GTPase activity (Roadblock/LC7/MglB family)
LTACGIDSVDVIHVLVVARDGTILARESGRHTDEAAARIRAVLTGE